MKKFQYATTFILSFLFFLAVPLFHNPAHAAWSVHDSSVDQIQLNDVSAVSGNDIWAVGVTATSSAVSKHYNGSTWNVVSTQTLGIFSFLSDVAAVAPNDVWAVGSYLDADFTTKTLIQRWNGTNWSIVPSPNISDSINNYLVGISAVSATDIWTVGAYQSSDNHTHTLVMHWDGANWSIVPSGIDVDEKDAILNGVYTVSATDIWAVGDYIDVNNNHTTLAKHWNGTSWVKVPSPNPTGIFPTLFDISASSANDIWAVGNYSQGVGFKTLVLHYDGTSWQIDARVSDEASSSIPMRSVKAVAANKVWVVGNSIWYYNGSDWVSELPPDNTTTTGSRKDIFGITSLTPSNLWAVGAYGFSGGGGGSYIVHFEPKTPVILIPGIMGSNLSVNQTFDPNINSCLGIKYLYNQGNLAWFDLGKALLLDYNCGNYLEVLHLQNDGQTSVYPQIGLSGTIVDAFFIKNIGYHDTLLYLKQQGYTLDQDLFIFPYDWRKDLSPNISSLDIKINAILATTSAQKVNFFAHSMGGLVAQEYIRDQSRANKVDKLVALGVPHVGTPKALAFLLHPTCLRFYDLVCIVNGSKINSLVQNFTGFFELLPSKQYYQLYPELLPFYDGKGVKRALSYSELRTYLTNLGKNMPLFNKAELFHDNLDPTYANNSNVKKYLIAGSGKETWGQLLDYTWNGQVNKLDAFLTDGDGTVPVKSATLDQLTNVFYVNQEHENLVANGPGLQMAVRLLNGETGLINGVQGTPFSSQFTGKLVSVHSPVALHAYDALGNHTGASSSGGFEANIFGSSYDELGDAKFIYLPDGGNYRIETRATGEENFDLKIKTYENSQLVKHELFIEVEQTANTKASMALDATPVLEVDTDNNGTVDQNLSPTYTLTGNNAFAIAPPTTTATLSPAANSEGDYSNPVTVTLSANASAGFSVTNMYYKIDEGAQKTYTAPFAVSGPGEHTITYWSVDSAGLVERENSETFTIVAPTLSCAPLPANIFAWWKGEGNAKDAVGGNHGTLKNGVFFTTGKVGKAFSNRNESSKVVVPFSSSLNPTSEITMEAWIKPNHSGGWTTILSKGNYPKTRHYGMWTQMNTGVINLSFFDTKHKDIDLETKRGTIRANKWYHVVGVIKWGKGGYMQLYVNGRLKAVRRIDSTPAPDKSPLVIGNEDDKKRGFSGIYDEVSLYSRALTSAEIQKIYKVGSKGKCAP